MIVPVFLASPFGGDVEGNLAYLKAAMFHSLHHGEAPYAPHMLYPAVLDDEVPADRELGILCGLAWLERAERLVLYCDRGFSAGMSVELHRAVELNLPVVVRLLYTSSSVPISLRQTLHQLSVDLTLEMR